LYVDESRVVCSERKIRSSQCLCGVSSTTAGDGRNLLHCIRLSCRLLPFSNAYNACGQIYQYVIHVTAHASVYTLVLMSLDRYLAVVHPLRSLTIRTRRNAVVALVFLWTLVIAANSPMLQHFSVTATPVRICVRKRKLTTKNNVLLTPFFPTWLDVVSEDINDSIVSTINELDYPSPSSWTVASLRLVSSAAVTYGVTLFTTKKLMTFLVIVLHRHHSQHLRWLFIHCSTFSCKKIYTFIRISSPRWLGL